MILEVEAREILLNYVGGNNQLLDWKQRFLDKKRFTLTRTQADYVIKYSNVIPKVAKKEITILKLFAEKLEKELELDFTPNKIWCEKLLCESDKAYHIYGKFDANEPLKCFWLPKAAILPIEKKLNRVIDYSKYETRPPMPHQKIGIEKLLANDKFILADGMGLGKTTTAVIASIESEAKKILIVCPSSLKINWKREIENYSDKKILIAEGGKWGSTFQYYIINYDILKNYHTLDKNEKNEIDSVILKENFELAIIDECHLIANPTAIRTKLLNDILLNIPKVWLLTGTPMTSRPMNFYNLLRIVNSPLASNWQNYVIRYCNGYQFKVKGKKVWNTSGASNLDELREATKPLMLRRLKEDVLDLPEKIVTPLYLELTNTFYDDEMEEFLKITNENKNKESISVTISRLMGIRKLIATEKVPYTCELAEKFLNDDKKVIIFTSFTSSLEMLHEYFGKKSVILDGRMSSIKRQESVDRFQNDPKIKVFISNIKAGGVGITLTEAEGTIMNDLSFVPSDHLQAEDRSHRYGVKKSVLIYYPIFENTIEKIVYNILNKKKNIIDQVLGDGEYSESFINDLIKNIS